DPAGPGPGDFAPYFVAANPRTGEIAWRKEFPGELRGGPLVTARSVYLACWDGNLYRIDRKDGAVVWKRDLGLGHWAAILTVARDRLYLCFEDKLVCVGNAR